MRTPERKQYSFKDRKFITEKIVQEIIEPNLMLLRSIDGVDNYKEAVKKEYTIGKYAADSFEWAFQSRILQLMPIEDEIPWS